MSHKRYNIAIIPPEKSVAQALLMNDFLADHGCLFSFSQEELYPHISLYHIEMPEEHVPLVQAVLRKILAEERSFMLQPVGYRAVEDVWVDVSYERGEALMKLHYKILEAIKEFRLKGVGEVYGGEVPQAEWQKLSLEQQKNIEEYGWSEAGELFVPHLTFGRLKEPKQDILTLLPQEDFSFEATALGLYDLGEHGTCNKLLEEFKLS